MSRHIVHRRHAEHTDADGHNGDTCPACLERLRTGLMLVVHHHMHHTQDGMTAARGPDADVLIVSDPRLRDAIAVWMRRTVTPDFPEVPRTQTIDLAHVPQLPATRVGSEPSPTNTQARAEKEK